MNISSYIDHTILKPTTLSSDIERVCGEAMEWQFAAVCVPPPFVQESKNLLRRSTVKTATVIGFPFGYSPVKSKMAELEQAIEEGADELDVVINLCKLKNNDWNFLCAEIDSIVEIARRNQKLVKAIIETGVLTEAEIIRCCALYGSAGVDYLKTSTGYAQLGATVEAVHLMRRNLSPGVKIKASGGIRSYEFARKLIDAGACRLGTSQSVFIVQEAKNLIQN